MSSRVPLQPMSSALPRRKPRICTREACETCREKKAKCDGEQPCSRCEARGLECRYQIRNHRTKRSLRNELNALKEKQQLQEVLLGALQDPERREAALRLLDTEDPLTGAAKLWLKDEDFELNGERALSAIPSKFSDDGHRSTSESASPFPEVSVPRRTQDDYAASAPSAKVSPTRRDSVPPNMHSTGTFTMPSLDPDTRGNHQMNPLMGPGGNQRFPQYPQSFPAAPGTSGMSGGSVQFGNGQLDGSDQMFAPPWLDPSLGTSFAQQQQKNLPFMPMRQGNVQQQPWMGISGNPMMQRPPLNFDSTQFKQWASPQVDDRKLPNASSPPPPNSASTTMSFNFDTSIPSNLDMTTTRFATPPASSAQGPRTSRRDSKRRTSAPLATSGNDQAQPRSDSRERHRLASARNWHKQKQATADLQATKDRVEAQHAALRNEYNDVLSQVQQVKLALLGHAGCNDPAIKMWLEREATGVVTGLQNPLSDGGMDAQDPSNMPDLGDNPYPTPEDDVVPGQKGSRGEANDMMMGGVEVNVKA